MESKVFYLYRKKTMGFVLLFVYLVLLLFIVYKLPFYHSEDLSSKIISLVFLTKFAAGVILYLIYAYFYGDRDSGDIFKYFDDGNIIYSAFKDNPLDYLKMVTGIGADSPHLMKYYDTCEFWIKNFNYGLLNDNRIIIRFNAIVRLISMGNIHIHTLFMSFLSFTGLWAIFKVFEFQFKRQKWSLLILVFFLPSVWFWTSGLLKEGLLIFAFGLLFYNVRKLFQPGFSFAILSGIVFCIFLLFLSKFYFLIAAMPGLLFLVVNRLLKNKYRILSFLLTHVLLLFLLWFSKAFTPYDFPQIIAQKQNDFINFTNSLDHVGSKIEMEKLEPTFTDMLKKAPNAIFNVLFRPSVFEVHNPMAALAAIENLLLLLLFLLAIVFISKKNLLEPYFLFSVSFTTILFILIGLTTPILGALVRYKAPGLPFLGILILYMIDFSKLESFLKRHKS